MDPLIRALGQEFDQAHHPRLQQLWRDILLAEATYEAELGVTLGGYLTVARAFQDFFLETLDRALQTISPRTHQQWGLLLLDCLVSFRSFRAAELNFHAGYPLAGYVLLRDLKDRALCNAAALSGHCDFPFIWGRGEMDGGHDQEERIRKVRVKEERRIRKLLLGPDSGLSARTREEIDGWEQLFHAEVHGSRLTYVEFGGWLKGEERLQLGPKLNEASSATYFNRATEIAWMWHRILPTLQCAPKGFGAEWDRRWQLVDDALRRMEESLSELGKPVADALVELVDRQFSFSPSSRFPDEAFRGDAR